jgi:hypothetical protein
MMSSTPPTSSGSSLTLSVFDIDAITKCFYKGKVASVSLAPNAVLMFHDVDTGKKLIGLIPIKPDVAIYKISVLTPECWSVDFEIKGVAGLVAELPLVSSKISEGINAGQRFCSVNTSMRSATLNWEQADACLGADFITTIFNTFKINHIFLNNGSQEAAVIEFSVPAPQNKTNI